MYATKKSQDDGDLSDEPIKYSTSKAADWKAEYSFSGQTREDVSHPYQPLVIVSSLAVFLIYFGYLREENDIDEQLSTPLHHRIEGLEELQLKNAIEYYKNNDSSYDTKAMEERLREIRSQKQVINS